MAICKEQIELHVVALVICFVLAIAVWFYMIGIGTAHDNKSDDKQAVSTDTSAGVTDIHETEPMQETSDEIPAQPVMPS